MDLTQRGGGVPMSDALRAEWAKLTADAQHALGAGVTRRR